MFDPNSLKIKLFADGANISEMFEMNDKSYIKGLTTNPTLMRKSGVENYENFAKEVLATVTTKPVSFEVFSDDFEEMVKQGKKIASWGENVYVKIPITNTRGELSKNVIRELQLSGIKVNVTAIMTLNQVNEICEILDGDIPSYISIFAGRIADTGRDPGKVLKKALEIMNQFKRAEMIWASPRELLNIFQAIKINCHVITATNDILKKLELVDYSLDEYSLDTVKMFANDAKDSGFQINI
jgi:transaldolase